MPPHGNLVILGPTVFSKSTLRLLNMTGLNILDNCAERWQRKSRQWLACRWLDGRSAGRASGRGRHGLEWEQSSEAYASSRGRWKVCPHQKDLGQVMRGTLRTEFQAWNSSSVKGLDRKLRLGSWSQHDWSKTVSGACKISKSQVAD